MQCISRIHFFEAVVGAGQETWYYRVEASKSGLFRKQVFACVQVFIELVEDQFFKNSRNDMENRYWPAIRPIISLTTLKIEATLAIFQES